MGDIGMGKSGLSAICMRLAFCNLTPPEQRVESITLVVVSSGVLMSHETTRLARKQ
ncbi:Uncharacterised protein [Salmonella enterica subsp. enterica]|uniref:Uncharacterized protein n=1 Tax=Salmonella enterica I TaxID=59201 RepID=A0A447PI21_SALET|nr:Uncharacterised protein [Salmonella enterica subsp. enterica]